MNEAPKEKNSPLDSDWPEGAVFTDGEGRYYDEQARELPNNRAQEPANA